MSYWLLALPTSSQVPYELLALVLGRTVGMILWIKDHRLPIIAIFVVCLRRMVKKVRPYFMDKRSQAAENRRRRSVHSW